MKSFKNGLVELVVRLTLGGIMGALVCGSAAAGGPFFPALLRLGSLGRGRWRRR